MRVTIIAHACVLIETGGERILIDPIFADVFASDTLRLHPARELDAERLIHTVTTLVITHIHLDHFHPPTLERFSRDLPVIVPCHASLIDAVCSLGFTQVIPLAPWESHQAGDARLLATPSDFELEELGMVVCQNDGTYWHMSDAIVTEAVGRRVKDEVGPVSLCSVKHQPLRTLIAYQRGLQSTMLDRDEMVATFEAACAAEPALLFPYFSGFAFHGRHAWANRHVCPYDAAEIARLLRRRLNGSADVTTVSPGDILQVDGRSVIRLAGESDLVSPKAGPPIQPWEPIDTATLAGLSGPAERVWLTLELRGLLQREVLPWVQAHLDQGTGLFDAYRDLQAVWQCVVHLGDGHKLHHSVDFRGSRPKLHLDQVHQDANVFSHISALDLWQVIRGQAGAEIFWMAGGYRIYEKLLMVQDGRFHEPTVQGWELYNRLPDPVTHYLRKAGRRRLDQ